MTLRLLVGGLTCAAWLSATGALAEHDPARVQLKPPEPLPPQAPTSTAVDALTVQAALTPAEADRRALSFVRTYAAATPKLDQYARWGEPLCVQITGLTPVEAYQIQARLTEIARSVGARVRSPGCSPNVEIKVSDAPQALLDRIAERQEAALGYGHRQNARILKTVTRPIQAWYMTATAGEAGTNAGALFTGVGGGRIDADVVDDPGGQSPEGCGDSRFSACLQSVFKHVLVVVDSGRTRDTDPNGVSDYVAMLSLSQPRSLDGCNALPSVIDLFSPACPDRERSPGMTPADRAYLTALYAADLKAKKSGEQSDIARRMAAILLKSKTP